MPAETITTPKTRLTVPGIFWRDHYERCGDHAGERVEVADRGRTVVVELDAEALDDLRSDADYYGNPGAPWDEDYLRIIGRSAKATLRAISRQAPFRLRIEGFRNPGEPEDRLFRSLEDAKAHAKAMDLARFKIWEFRPGGANGDWFCVYGSIR